MRDAKKKEAEEELHMRSKKHSTTIASLENGRRRDHESRKAGSLQQLRARRQGPQSYNHMGLNSAKHLTVHKNRSPPGPPERKAALPSA